MKNYRDVSIVMSQKFSITSVNHYKTNNTIAMHLYHDFDYYWRQWSSTLKRHCQKLCMMCILKWHQILY